jgi:ATP-binding cassette subfamily B multidrug efflux pump
MTHKFAFIQTFEYLFPYLKRYRKKIILGTLFIISGTSIGIITPKIVQRAIDYLSGDIEINHLIYYAALIILISIIHGFFRFMMRQTIIVGSRLIENDFRNDIFAHLQKMSTNFYFSMATGDIMSRMTNDLNAVRSVLGPGIMYSINTIITFVFVIWMMVSINLYLTFIALIPIPLMTFAVYYFGRKIKIKYTEIQAQYARISSKAQENISGIRIIKTYVQEKAEIDNFNRLNQQYIEKNMAYVRVFAAFHPIILFIIGLGAILVLLIAGIQIVNNTISLGEFVAFSLYLNMLVWPSIALGWVAGIFQQGAASMQRINTILTSIPEITDKPESPKIAKLKGNIEINNLTFYYNKDESPILKDISLFINTGKIIAIVGKTGSGKTTLLNILARIFNPPQKTIFIDGIDLWNIPLETLRANYGYIPQETFLFSDTIEENIRYGKVDVSIKEIQKVAEIARIHDTIDAFPNKYQTMLGERGINLSGGQKQRISLARALIKNPKILLLDDALSAVDTLTEKTILTNLRQVMDNKTCIWVSHRISAIQHADKIIVLENGGIAEEGTHDSLLALDGIYNDLYDKQQLEEALALTE